VLADQQPTPLPMQAPSGTANGTVMGGGTTDAVADQVLLDVLGNILDGN
ncbi:MAG: hypothetical protein ACI9TA_003144, partial [Reinekea sp.]